MNSEDGQVYSVCILQCSCLTKYNRMQSKHKQTNVNIADKTLTDYRHLFTEDLQNSTPLCLSLGIIVMARGIRENSSSRRPPQKVSLRPMP